MAVIGLALRCRSFRSSLAWGVLPTTQRLQLLVFLYREYHNDRPLVPGHRDRFDAGKVDQPSEAALASLALRVCGGLPVGGSASFDQFGRKCKRCPSQLDARIEGCEYCGTNNHNARQVIWKQRVMSNTIKA